MFHHLNAPFENSKFQSFDFSVFVSKNNNYAKNRRAVTFARVATRSDFMLRKERNEQTKKKKHEKKELQKCRWKERVI